MELSGIISISGKPGLSKIVSQTRTGLIVESLQDGKRSAVHGAERVSSLEDISIYTYEEDLLLSEVFTSMLKAADHKPILSHKSSAVELKNYLQSVIPNYDQDRVYVSDIKKLVQWYNILLEKDLLKLDSEEKADTKKTADKKESKAKSPAKKTTTKKTGQSATKNKANKPSGKAAPSKKSSTKASSKGK
ncbi:MAG: DUF5606 domain-containing protein [Vicingaceae bacterium]